MFILSETMVFPSYHGQFLQFLIILNLTLSISDATMEKCFEKSTNMLATTYVFGNLLIQTRKVIEL